MTDLSTDLIKHFLEVAVTPIQHTPSALQGVKVVSLKQTGSCEHCGQPIMGEVRE